MNSQCVSTADVSHNIFGSFTELEIFTPLEDVPESHGDIQVIEGRLDLSQSRMDSGGTQVSDDPMDHFEEMQNKDIQLPKNPVDYLEPELGDGLTEAPDIRMARFEADMKHGHSQVSIESMEYLDSEIGEFPSHLFVAGPLEAEDLETCVDATSYFKNMIEPGLHTNPKMAVEAKLIVSRMMGKVFYEEEEKAGSQILSELLSYLHLTLQIIEGNDSEIALDTFNAETCKWVYGYMRSQGRKVAVHPQHVKDIPKRWQLRHPGLYYPSEKAMKDIAEDSGLEIRQVSNLFENDRKRRVKPTSRLDGKLKSHFSSFITKKLKAWQIENPEKTQPDQKTQHLLMEETGLDKRQITDWFNNHKVGRNRSKKKSREIPK